MTQVQIMEMSGIVWTGEKQSGKVWKEVPCFVRSSRLFFQVVVVVVVVVVVCFFLFLFFVSFFFRQFTLSLLPTICPMSDLKHDCTLVVF